MCNCIKEIKEDIKKKYEAKEEIEEVTSISIENTALMFNNNAPSTVELYSPMKIEYDYKNAKGQTKHKKEKANMSYKYCPFCGKAYSERVED